MRIPGSFLKSLLWSASLPAGPIIPNAESFEQINAFGFDHRLLNLIMGESRSDFSRQICQFNA